MYKNIYILFSQGLCSLSIAHIISGTLESVSAKMHWLNVILWYLWSLFQLLAAEKFKTFLAILVLTFERIKLCFGPLCFLYC